MKSRKTNTFLCLFLVIVCILFAASAKQQNERITELETERDIYQGRAEAAEAALAAEREVTLPEWQAPEILPDALPMGYVGEFDVTANCCESGCAMCGGTGITASGAPQVAGVTAGANFEVLPAGTVIYIEDVGVRVVQDTGPDCPADHIDIAVDTHAEALSWPGYGKHSVYVLQEAK